ncbi:DUF1616 domain-containing protein [Salinilacihabitans rarus]|uniref:DUF1616 domain-containing protein n=1 Tax=Salinilacihabitans rarus TaxID=2961596 RepID=UPI0031BBBBBA
MSLRTKTETRFRYVLRYPTDLAAVSVLAVLGYLAATAYPTGSTLRLTAALALVAVLPGYALVSALFPAQARRARPDAATAVERRPGGIDTVERLGLSVPLSLIVAALAVLALPLADRGLAAEPVVGALALVAVALAQVGAVRRLRVPEPDRYTVSPLLAIRRLRESTEGAVATATSVLLVLAVVAAAGALLVAFVAPMSASSYSELEIYTADESGELVAGAFPDAVEPGESIPVTFVVENYEGEETEYTLVVQEQVIEDGEVVERTELRTVDVLVTHGDGGWVTAEREVTPTADPGETVRVSFLLFEGDPPAEPTNENAYEDVYFWTTVAEDEDAASAAADEGAGGGDGGDEAGTDEDDGGGEDAGGDDDDEDDDDDDDDSFSFDDLFDDEDDEDEDDLFDDEDEDDE